MCGYRCYFISAAGHIGAVEEIDCANDAEATQIAIKIFAERPQHDAIEVWNRDRMVTHHPETSVWPVSP